MYWHPSFNARKLKYVFKSLTYTLNQNITRMVYNSRYNSVFSYSITTCGVSAKTHIGNWKGAAWYFEGGLYEDWDVLTIGQVFILNTIYFGEINRCLTILMFLGTTNENVMYMRQDIENGTLS